MPADIPFNAPVCLEVRTSRRVELTAITPLVQQVVKDSGLTSGLCVVYVPHTTAGVTINENADPDVVADLEAALAQLVPREGEYRHLEGNSDAHVKASLMGSSVSILVQDGDLLLGRWQGVFLCEFDGPRSRSVYVKLLGG
ncbi:MAG: secondary thiamine-phosphate synthase enzyme YjbQ [Candidatus Sumerlaeota bacterium]|nr:secondary thiamine-phosphate synthase enzyme YjbQ [Candidatus Sumerlaeota bacterium]